MNQKILDNLVPGEKAVDIQEYFWGENGSCVVYKVTIYTCNKYAIFFKRINAFSYPFYFATKELAESFVQNHEKIQLWSETISDDVYYWMTIKNYSDKSIRFYMIDTYYQYGHERLKKGYVWNGIVNYDKNINIKYCVESKYNTYYLNIFDIEKAASKEGTIGKTFSYKLSEIEN